MTEKEFWTHNFNEEFSDRSQVKVLSVAFHVAWRCKPCCYFLRVFEWLDDRGGVGWYFCGCFLKSSQSCVYCLVYFSNSQLGGGFKYMFSRSLESEKYLSVLGLEVAII